ncbi:hypothetical protein BGZ72_004071 [Mortierella alpina]|nr:hypothetical protein BGZ72_004071 [Mortierella alpina]
MSSDFAEFLFSFACSKLESSPQLDLRQQLLHSNLIRHILLVHPPAPTTTTNSNNADTRRDDDARRLLALPPLPPSPPPQQPAPQSLGFCSPSASPPSKSTAATTQSNTYGLDLSSFQQFQPSPQHQPLAGVALSHWSPFCFDDELDRIHPQAIVSQNSPRGPAGGPEHVALQEDQDVVMMEEDPAALNLFPPYVYFRDSYHPSPSSYDHGYVYGYGYGLDEDDDDYRFASTRAQEDWLDAVLEDLIEEDQQEDDSSHEYDSEDDLFCTETKDMGLTRGKAVKPDKDDLIEPRPSAWSAQRGLFPDSMILDPSADAMWP